MLGAGTPLSPEYTHTLVWVLDIFKKLFKKISPQDQPYSAQDACRLYIAVVMNNDHAFEAFIRVLQAVEVGGFDRDKLRAGMNCFHLAMGDFFLASLSPDKFSHITEGRNDFARYTSKILETEGLATTLALSDMQEVLSNTEPLSQPQFLRLAKIVCKLSVDDPHLHSANALPMHAIMLKQYTIAVEGVLALLARDASRIR